MSGGSDSTPATQQVNSTTTTSNLPEYARPYFEDIMNRAQAESNREYVPYEDQRIAGLTSGQQATNQQVMGMQSPTQFGDATALAQVAGLGSLNAANYAPTNFSAQTVDVGTLNQLKMLAGREVQGQQYNAPQMQGNQTGYNPNLNNYLMTGAQQVQGQQYNSPLMGTAQTNFNTGALNNYQMATPSDFGQAQADQYMSPYMQSVLNVQKREAITDAQKSQLVQDLGAVRQGTYGGARQLLAGTERERALGQQLGDIEAKGMQSAYENAQSQYERDRSANMTAGQANLQANLGVQQLGMQSGLQAALANLSSAQQANVQNQAAVLQTQGLNADQALKAALANQQSGLQVGQQNLQSLLQTQELGANTGLQAALANLTAAQQTSVQNQAAILQTQGLNADQALRAAMANQQMDLTVGQQNLQSGLQTQDLQTKSNLQAQIANQQADLQAQQQAEQSKQYAASLGLQGYGQALEAGRTLGNLGLTQQQSDLSRLQAQSAVGSQEQQLQQQELDLAYADFLRQRDYPMEQLGYYSNLMRGVPVGLGSTSTTYAPPPSIAAQVGGLGLGALGLYNTAKG